MQCSGIMVEQSHKIIIFLYCEVIMNKELSSHIVLYQCEDIFKIMLVSVQSPPRIVKSHFVYVIFFAYFFFALSFHKSLSSSVLYFAHFLTRFSQEFYLLFCAFCYAASLMILCGGRSSIRERQIQIIELYSSMATVYK